jgi:hypothetical protein
MAMIYRGFAVTLININKPPSKKDIHLWGDFIELLCLLNPDGVITKADTLDRLQDEMGIDKTLDNQEDLSLNDPNDVRSNILELRADDWFNHLVFRAGVFEKDDFYPFVVGNGGDCLTRKSDLSLKHQLYVFFLIASNLKYVTPSLKSRIAGDFEALGELAMQKCFPDGSNVYIFGTGGLPSSKKLSGNLFLKIKQLSELLSERVVIDENKLAPQDVGDGGLDIVGWLPLGDSTGGLFCMFGQCACSYDEWSTKQHSSSFSAWRKKITLTAPPSNAVFIPFCFRDNNGDWWNPQDIHDSIVFDRVRMIHLLRDRFSIIEALPTFADIVAIIDTREDLV